MPVRFRFLWVIATFSLLLLLPSCGETPGIAQFRPSFLPYVSGFTSGTISKADPIEVVLTTQVATPEQIGEQIPKDLFSFTPSIEGRAEFAGVNTIRFIPEQHLPSNTLYTARFHLGGILQLPDSLSYFAFNFKTRQQNIDFQVEHMRTVRSIERPAMTLEATLFTADVMDAKHLENHVQVTYQDKAQSVSWRHDANGLSHHLTVGPLPQSEASQDLRLTWDGGALDVPDGDTILQVPGLKEFKVSAVRVRQVPDPKVTIEFSHRLQQEQSVEGLIGIEGVVVALEKEANLVHVFPQQQAVGQFTLTVQQQVENIYGASLSRTFAKQITFEAIKPAVRLLGDGVIMPQSTGLIFPFEAVSLSHVDVTVIKIFEDNVLQFLQANALDEKSNLQRVGRIVATKTIPLEPSNPQRLHQWTRYGIALDDLVLAEPGAIYHVGLSFRPSYGLYDCGEEAPLEDPETVMPYMNVNWESYEDPQFSNWSYYEAYMTEDYSWSDRDNPCKKMYYRQERFVGRNVLASNLGIIAKRANNGTFTCVVTDLLTTEPLANTALTVYDFQQQPIAQLQTDSEGKATTVLHRTPFAVVASHKGQKGYLKLQDGNALSVSRLDVDGVIPQEGVNAFLYAERDVWRPGDSVYLQLMVTPEDQPLPPRFPVQFSLSNPQGQVVEKRVVVPAAKHHYDLRFATTADAPTGNWLASVQVGGATFSKRLKIETIQPNRLKVRLSLADSTPQNRGVPIAASLHAAWLHGASARGLKYAVEMQLQSMATAFSTYREYTFSDPANDFSMEPVTVAEGQLDAAGKAGLQLDIHPDQPAPGRLQAQFKTRVFEPGGDFSVDRLSVPYDPYGVYVGIKTPKGDAARGMLLTDTMHQVKLVTLNPQGEPVLDRSLAISLYKLDFSWWWNQEDMAQLASYISRSYVSPVQQTTVTTNAKGEATWGLQINYPQWGNYLIRVKDISGGHTTGKTVFIDWPGWAGRGQRERPGGAALLSLSSDREQYTVGDAMQLTIPSPEGGRAWVSLETGKRIVRQFWIALDKGQTIVDITATPEMAPNVYAYVTLIQPHAQTANDLPIRLYGAIPLLVEYPKTHLHPEVATAGVWTPETAATVQVSEADGRPMTYTLAVVDEGLLDLTRFPTPDPWQHFYARQALGVKTYDVYDMVLGAFGGRLEQLLSIGGDVAQTTPPPGKRGNRFEPMVRFLGPFTLGKGETRTHVIPVPKYVGAARIMVVARQEKAYGHTDRSVTIKKPLMVLGTAPRVLSPMEKVEVPVSVFTMEQWVQNVTVRIEVNKLLTISGDQTRQVTFARPGDQLVPFTIAVKEGAEGVAKVTYTATSGNTSASHTISIPVRNPNPFQTQKWQAQVAPQATATLDLQAVGAPSTAAVALEVSPLPYMNLNHRLSWLLRYPHGCVEQTTSRAFPQLYVDALMELSPEQLTKRDLHIKVAIGKIQRFQQPNGGISYWQGLANVQDWSTSYAGHFMLEAKAKGYALPYDFLDKWIGYQQQAATQWRPDRLEGQTRPAAMLLQAYRLYTLALAGTPELGAMNLLREQEKLPPTAGWRLASAYALAGQQQQAMELARQQAVEVMLTNDAHTFGSEVRNQAIILECMTLLGLQDKAENMAEQVAKVLMAEEWMSTQSTAYSLMALARYAIPRKVETGKFSYQWNGQWQSIVMDKPLWQSDLPVADAIGPVKITNQRSTPLYVTGYVTGQPLPGEEVAGAANLKLAVTYQDKEGHPVNPEVVRQGEDVIIVVKVSHPGGRGDLQHLALTQVLPSGFRLINTRLDAMEQWPQESAHTYRDIRDDRVNIYFDLEQGTTKQFYIPATATYLGRFYWPGVAVEAMYDKNVYARQLGRWMTISLPGENLSATK